MPLTVEQAKENMRKNLDDGVICPCCNRLVRMYKRKISSVSAVCLIRLYKMSNKSDNHWFHISDIQGKSGGGDFAKLRYFGLVEEASNENPSKRTSGFWRITNKGRRFVKGWLSVPCYVKVYNGKVYGEGSETITIYQALNEKFNYEELMGAPHE